MPKHSLTALNAIIESTIAGPEPRAALVQFLAGLKGLATTPASSRVRYHHAYQGGLVDHIIETFQICRDLNATRDLSSVVPRPPNQDILLVAILHDIHKVQDAAGTPCYQPNILKSGKQSEAEPFEKTAGCLHAPFSTPVPSSVEREYIYQESVDKVSDGIKSLALVKALAPTLFDALNEDVRFAIRHHDGAYGTNKYDLAGKETTLQILFHCADMLSSRLNRVTK